MGKQSKVTIGYKYLMTLLFGDCYGQVDEYTEIRVGDREAWKGSVTTNTTINIDKPDLFGGDESEGGIQGTLEFMFGAPDQPVNQKLVAMFGHPVSAFRHRSTLLFDGMVCALSKYPKPWALRRNRRTKGWDGGVWYPEKVAINLPGGIKAMNPAHIIYQLLTDRRQGLGRARARLDDAAFRAAADTLHAENFGMCIQFSRQGDVKEFVEIVRNTIGANLFLHRVTGLWTIRLVRDNYNVNALPVFTYNTGLISIGDDDNAANVLATNQITVNYFDVLKKTEGSVTVKNSAAIAKANGKVNPETVSYPGVPVGDLAARLGARDLRAKFNVKRYKVILDRRGYQVEPGGAFRISSPADGIENLVLRAATIDDGDLADGKITIDAVLDVFGLPANSFVDVQPPLWSRPNLDPLPATQRLVREATYRDLALALGSSALESLTPGTNYVTATAAAPTGFAQGFDLETRVGSSAPWVSSEGEFCPTATIAAAMPKGAAPVAVTLENTLGIEAVLVGTACVIDDEIFRVDAINAFTKTATLARGCIDTVPAAHAAGAMVWFYQDYAGASAIDYAAAANVQVRMLTRTGAGKLSTAPVDTYTMNRRRERPYPPGNVKINAVAYPEKITGALTVSFSYRNRLVQADQLIDTTVNAINDEASTTYRVKVVGDGVQLDDLVLPPDANVFELSIDDEKLAGLTHLPHNFNLRTTGLQAVTSTLSTNLYLFNGDGFFAQQFAKVSGGWLTFYNLGNQVRGAYVDDSTGLKTIAICDLKAQTRTQLLTFVEGVPKVDSYIAESTNSSFTGWATYWVDTNSADNGYVSERLGIYKNPPFKDRRANPDHIITTNYGFTNFSFSSQRYTNVRSLNYIEYSLHVVKKSAVTPGGPLTTQRTIMDAFWLSTANQFDSATGAAPEVPPYMNLDSIMKAHNAHDLVYETGVVFGSVLYVHYHRGTGSATTAGKALDITNVVTSGHINYKTGTELVTKTYSITAAGVLTPLTTRVGFYIADQLNATQGVEILYSTRQVWLVNASTGAQGALLGTLDFDPCAVYGDTTNEHIYILGVDGTLRKFNSALTLLNSIYVGATDRALPWILRQSNIKESMGFFYVQYAAKTFYVTKDFAVARAAEGFTQTFPGYANPSSSIVLMHAGTGTSGTGLADEAGIASTVFNQPKARVAGSLTIEVSSEREGLASNQKHVITTKRVGYGLRYGFNYRW